MANIRPRTATNTIRMDQQDIRRASNGVAWMRSQWQWEIRRHQATQACRTLMLSGKIQHMRSQRSPPYRSHSLKQSRFSKLSMAMGGYPRRWTIRQTGRARLTMLNTGQGQVRSMFSCPVKASSNHSQQGVCQLTLAQQETSELLQSTM